MLKPRNDYVLVKRDRPEEISDGGIVIPQIAPDSGEAPAEGVVLSVGPKARDVKPGDRVLIGAYGGTTVKVHGEDVVLVREGELGKDGGILAVLE